MYPQPTLPRPLGTRYPSVNLICPFFVMNVSTSDRGLLDGRRTLGGGSWFSITVIPDRSLRKMQGHHQGAGGVGRGGGR